MGCTAFKVTLPQGQMVSVVTYSAAGRQCIALGRQNGGGVDTDCFFVCSRETLESSLKVPLIFK